MRISYTPEQEELRRELRSYFTTLMTPERREALSSIGGEIGVGNVENILEHRLQPKCPRGPQGMFARPVRQNELASGQGRNRACEGKIGEKR